MKIQHEGLIEVRAPSSAWSVCLSGMLFLFAFDNANAQAVQSTTTAYEYDAQGNLTKVTDPLGRNTALGYDTLSRLKQQVQPSPGVNAVGEPLANPVISYAYDGLDQLAQVVDPLNSITSYSNNGLGNQTSLASPATGTTINTYDAAGNLKTTTDARGKKASFTYDALNRVTRVAYESGAAIDYEYDGGTAPLANDVGHLTNISDESGSTRYRFDEVGNVVSKTQTAATVKTFVVSYDYALGRLNAVTYPSGNRINFGYDAAGRTNWITLNPTNSNGIGTNVGSSISLMTAIGYDPFGKPNSWIWGSSSEPVGHSYARVMDTDGRVTSYPLGNPQTGGVDRTVVYDAASRITNTNHIGGGGTPPTYSESQTYGYDDLNRLTQFTGGNANLGYIYDANGNRTQTTSNAAIYLPGTAEFTYSDRGRMASVKLGNDIVTYRYNGIGQRTIKRGPSTIVPTGTVHYVYDEKGRLLGEYDSNGKIIQETVWLGDMPVGIATQTVGATGAGLTSTNLYYIYADHINTPRVITRASDNLAVWRWDQTDPFGGMPPDENPSGLGLFTFNLRFPGQYFDKESNLHYNYYRDYDPQTGRYVQSDPIGLDGGTNTYGYVGGNPLSFVDPEGLQFFRPFPNPVPVPPLPIPGPGLDPTDPSLPADKHFWPKSIRNAAQSASDTASRLFKAKESLDECENRCDADYDRDQKTCEWMWKMRGRKSEDYQLCMSRARAIQITCYQDCMRECT